MPKILMRQVEFYCAFRVLIQDFVLFICCNDKLVMNIVLQQKGRFLTCFGKWINMKISDFVLKYKTLA